MRALLALAAIAGCAAPRFRPAASVESAPGGPLVIERIDLRWSSAYLIERDGAAVLVDSGSPTDQAALADALAARGLAPSAVRAAVITHAHADHAGCARWLQRRGTAIVLGAGDVATAAQGRNVPLRPTGLLGALLATVFMFPFDPFTPDLAVDHETDLGRYGFPEVRVIPVGGHTAGAIVVLVGREAFVGDLIKGGEIAKHSPTEHLYQTDRAVAYRALRDVLGRGVDRLQLGHSGPVSASDVATWLDGADPAYRDRAIDLELEVAGEHAELAGVGASAGMRLRYGLGHGPVGVGYIAGVDLRGGYLDGAVLEADAHPIGLSLRSRAGALVAVTGSIGVGRQRGATASRAGLELAAEAPAGPTRLLARGRAAWAIGGLDVVEASALAGVRLGRDRTWGTYVAGKGPFLALRYDIAGDDHVLGIALGFDAFAAH